MQLQTNLQDTHSTSEKLLQTFINLLRFVLKNNCYSISVLIDDVSYSIRLFIILVVLWLVDAGAWCYAGACLSTSAAACLSTTAWWSAGLLAVRPVVLWIAASSTVRVSDSGDYSEQDQCGTDWQDDRNDGVVVVSRNGFSAWMTPEQQRTYEIRSCFRS